MSNVISSLFGKAPRAPRVMAAAAEPVTRDQTEGTRDELLRRMAKLRRATLTSELSNPNIKRKTLGAGT